MFRFVKTILHLIVAALIIFFVISLWGGGDKFRWYGERLGEKADSIKAKRDEAAEMIKKLTGSGVFEKPRNFLGGDKEGNLEQEKKPVKKHNVVTDETSKAKTKETDESQDALSGGSEGNKPPEGLWSTLWKKIKALTKE